MTDDVKIIALHKQFTNPENPSQTVHAVRDINLAIQKGQLVTLLGPSGCGKTTLLRMIAGFEEPTSGDIMFGEKRMNDVAPNLRDAAMVFQSYAIFPHLNVFENIAFGLRLKKISRSVIDQRVNHVMEVTGLQGYATRSPNQLSGGQQQRVALARAIVMEPSVLLFDEPLSNLDAKLREQMRVEIRELQQRLGITSLYVTHDQVEAMSISDLIVVMNKGNVEQIGTPYEVYARPATKFVADFIGKGNFPTAKVTGKDKVELAGVTLELGRETGFAEGDNVTLIVRPEAVKIHATQGEFASTVKRAMFLGNVAEYLIDVDGLGDWLVDVASPAEHGQFATGERVFLSPSRASLHLLPV
ncbi:ABC transporter ATP-binding protein [Paenochrobactrum sp. BZR 588]|uniref:ABC transporter ATP-binding protein n=1 Tax=Paenochrobactrum TaxID=999488 RepID=UPI0035BC3AB4